MSEETKKINQPLELAENELDAIAGGQDFSTLLLQELEKPFNLPNTSDGPQNLLVQRTGLKVTFDDSPGSDNSVKYTLK
ncbi:hypothetical protein NIES2098_23180 [Calothrix sp. NIES-2098]|nr:hypothetical protein NIES2098_23180 [Calothrix sp. NIES-2098]